MNITLSEATSPEDWHQSSPPAFLAANWKMIICKSTCPSCTHTNTNKHVALQIFHHQNHFVLKLSLVRFPMSQHPYWSLNDHCLKGNLQSPVFVNRVFFFQAFQMTALIDRAVFATLAYPSFLQGSWNTETKNTACKSDKHRLSNKGVWKSSQGKKPVSKLFPRSASHNNGDNLQPFAIIILKASSFGIDPADLKFSMEESWLIILLHSSSLQLGLYLSCAWPGVHLLPACTSTPGNDPSLSGPWGGAKPTYRHGIQHGTYMCAILSAPNPKILDIGDEENEGSPVTKTVIAWRDRKGGMEVS